MTKSAAADRTAGIDYALVGITRQVVAHFSGDSADSLEKGFATGKGPPPQTALGIGDDVEVTIFEAQAGGLFIPDDAGSRPGNYITLPRQTVDRGGMISVPYAGAIRAAGRPVGEVQAEIERRLANRAIEPQVIITTTLNRSSNISVLGEVGMPAQLNLSPAGERVLDVIARAGGITAPRDETYVTVERQNRRATAPFRILVDRPAENIYMRPGDTVYVSRERRTYLVFGATQQAGRIDFDDSDLTLGEAIAKAGGLLDSRADPAQVFLYRQVPREWLRDAGVDVSRLPGRTVATVFRADLRDPAMLFAIQQFRMRDKDIIYVANADAVELTKFLTVVNGVSETTAYVPANVVTTRNAVRRLGK